MADNWLERLFGYEEFNKYIDLQTEYYKALVSEYLLRGEDITRGKIQGIKETWFFPLEKLDNEEIRKRLKQHLRKRIANIEIEASLEEDK